MQEKEEEEDDEVQTKLQLLIDHFLFEKLFNVMSRNGCKILASVYDKMTKLYGLSDLFKPNGSSHDRKNLLNLYSGGNWARHFRSLRGRGTGIGLRARGTGRMKLGAKLGTLALPKLSNFISNIPSFVSIFHFPVLGVC